MTVFLTARIILLALAVGGLIATRLPGQQSVNQEALAEEAVRLTQEYLRINTTNPPGNEDQAMLFFARIFEREGIPFDTASSAPGRGNIWARLEGGSAPGLLLLHHMDVVTADPRYWDVDPFSATIKDGDIYGRGALDTKTLGITELMAFLALHRSGRELSRDVVFMATADEEAGGYYGAGWIVENHPEAFEGVELLLNEGGGGSIDGDRRQFGIEVTQKVPLWLELTATGRPGHGSTPPVESAVNRLVRALYRIQTYDFEPRIVPAVDAYFKGLAPNAPPQLKAAFEDMSSAVQDPNMLLGLHLLQPGLAALTRNTCSITMLEGSAKINVVPTEATAQIDCRMLPDQDHDAFIEELQGVMNEPAIEIEQIMAFTPAVSSTDTPLYNALVEVTRRHFPNAQIVPAVSTGFTDSHFFRDLGIASYGYSPFVIPSDQQGGVHGNNERISVENVRRGTGIMVEIVDQVTRR